VAHDWRAGYGPRVPSDELEPFRLGLLNVFRNMDEQGLSNASRDRLRMAFDHSRKHGPAHEAPMLTGQLQGFHDRIVSFMKGADRERSTDQVADLEAFVREHLPEYY
jgi:hypothetical protein